MANYYYLVPTLPSLRPDMDDYMSLEEFLALCRGHLTKKDYEILSHATLTGSDEVEGNAFMKAFSRFRSMVDSALIAERAAKLGLKDPCYANRGDREGRIQEAVKKAVRSDDPLMGEKLILNLYWGFLENNLGLGHYFDLTFLISYALRLQILSRLSSFTLDKGNAEFAKLFGQLKEEIFR